MQNSSLLSSLLTWGAASGHLVSLSLCLLRIMHDVLTMKIAILQDGRMAPAESIWYSCSGSGFSF